MLKIFSLLLPLFVTACLVDYAYGIKKGNFAKTATTLVQLSKWKKTAHQNAEKTTQKREDATAQKSNEYIELVMNEYGTPVPISRIVKADKKKGQLYSSEKSMQTILEFIYKMLDHKGQKNTLDEMVKDLPLPENGCYVTFSVEKDMYPKAFLFDTGTTVPANDVEDLEIFEERETGRREIRQMAKVKNSDKKGHWVGKKQRPKKGMEISGVEERTEGVDEAEKEEENKTGKVEKDGEGKDGEEEEKEEEEEEEDGEPTNLSTYAAMLAIQKGQKGFGDKPYLDYKNLPHAKDKYLLGKMDNFFQQLIDACEGQHDPETTEKDEGIKYKEIDELNMEEFKERAIKSEGKLENVEDFDMVEKELKKNFDKILKSIMVSTDKERKELKNVIVETKEKIHSQLDIDDNERQKLAAQEKVDAYKFLQTIHYTIGTRPVYFGFKKLSLEEFEELVRLAENPPALQNEILNEKIRFTDLQNRIADAMLYEKTSSLSKIKLFLWQQGKEIGISFIQMLKKLKILPESKEETSGEWIKKLESAKEREDISFKIRREILLEAIDVIKDEKNGNCFKLKEPIQLAIYGNAEAKSEPEAQGQKIKPLIDTLMQDVQARLGAQALNSVINTKRFPEGHSTAVGMSVVGSGFIGIALDVFLVPILIMGFTGVGGLVPWVGAALIIILKVVIKPIMESMTPLGAETFDSAIVKDYMESLKGKPFWRGLKHFRKSIFGAMESGMIAAAGSLLYNFSMLLPPHFFAVQLVLNVLATFTSAAMVPKELAKTRDQTMKAIYKMKETGFFEKPSENFTKGLANDMRQEVRRIPSIVNKYRRGRNREEEIRAAYTNWIEQQTWRTMEVAQSSRLSINSMGIGPIVSSVIFTMMQGVTSAAPTIPGTNFKLIPETVTSAVSVMFNAPTEMISFTGAILGANNLGLERFPWLMSNDEQKNLQIMAKIFEKSSKQYENIKGKVSEQFEEITDDEMHKIYNPFLNTMGLGRFFVRKGIWLWKKWDQFKQRNEYKRKESAALSEYNPDKLVVENWKEGMVYLITLPRTNTVQSLSPKALALEFWLRTNIKQNHYYRISDGLFVPQLFNEREIPYVELNGQNIHGSLHEIITKISMTKMKGNTSVTNANTNFEKKQNTDEDKKSKEFYKKYIQPLKKALEEERKWGGMDFIVGDKALLEEMISTMSQLYPKLVEYEVDNVDSWDAMPWQLKQLFKRTFPYLVDRERGEHLNDKGEKSSNARKIIDVIDGMNKITEHIEQDDNGIVSLADQKSTIMEPALFGILAQILETSFSSNEWSDDERPLYKYYKQMVEKMGGHRWSGLKANPVLNYDYQVNVGAKYNGQFQLHLAKRRNGKNVDMDRLNTFAYIRDIIHEPEPDVVKIEAEMRAEKVNHEWVGPMWKVKRQWKDGEFEPELDKRVEEAKKKMHRENVGQTFLQHYSYTVEAITDKLIGLVWDSADNIARAVEFASPHENAFAVNSLEDAEKELGTMLFKIITEYKQGRGVELAQNKADNHVFRKLVLYDKAGKFSAQRIRDIMLNGVDKFYDQECTKLIVHQFERDIPYPISNQQKENSDKASTMDLEQKGGEQTPVLPIEHSGSSKGKMPMEKGETSITKLENIKSTSMVHDDNLEKRKNRIEKLLNDMLKEGKKFTLKRLTDRAEHVFTLEIGELLGNAVKFLKEAKIGHKTIEEQIPAEVNDLNCEAVKLLDRQREAIEYIDKNGMRLNRVKTQRGAIDRMFRVFDRYINMKKQAQDCFETLVQMTNKMANSLAQLDVKKDGNGQTQFVVKKDWKGQQPDIGQQWREFRAKVHKMEDRGLQRQDESAEDKVDDDLLDKLEEHLAKTAVRTNWKNRVETIKMELKQIVKMEKWKKLKAEVDKFDDAELRKTLIEEKKKLEEAINQLDKLRRQKIEKDIPAIYSWNEAMMEFVKDKIIEYESETDIAIAIDIEVMKEEKLANLRKGISENLGVLANKEQDLLPKADENQDYHIVATKVDAKISQVIEPSQKEVVEKMRDIHNKHGGAEALECVRENVTKAIGGYTVVKEAIGKLDPRNVNIGYKTNMLKMIDEQIKQLKALSETLSKFNGNRMETKKNILAKLGEIKPEMIAENVKTLKSFLYFIKWTKKIPKEEVDAKHTALQALIGQLEKDEESGKTLQTLAKINAKIEAIYARQMEEKKKLSNFVHASLEGQKLDDSEMTMQKMDAMISTYADEICELEKADKIFAPIENAELRQKIQDSFKVKSKELCTQRTGARIVEDLKFKKMDEKSANPTVGTALESGHVNEGEEYFNKKIANCVEEENKKCRIRMARQVKQFGKQLMKEIN